MSSSSSSSSSSFGRVRERPPSPDGEAARALEKKHSRLARIEDEEQRIFICSDQESVSCDGDSLRKELISDNESRIAGLVNRAKYMKNDQSVFWLRGFKEYIDQTPEEVEIKNDLTEISLSHQNIRQRKGHKTSGSSSEYVTNLAKTAEGGTRSGISESSDDAYIGDSCSNDMTRMKPSVVNGGSVSLIETNSGLKYEQDKLKFISIEPQRVSPLEVKLHLSPSYSTTGHHKVEDIARLTPLTAMDAIPGSQPSPMYPSSPPHYREDILHHRLYLEEEFLQQSVDSLSMGSSDSDTSSNGDASCELSSSASDLDSLLIQTCTKQGFSDYSWVSLNMGHADRRCDTDNSIGHVSDIGENISINEDKPSSVRDISNDGGYGLGHIASQEVGGIEKRRGKWKLKRELISLSEDLNTEPVFDKPNGSIEVIETELKDTYWQRKIIGGEAATNLGQSYHDDHSSMAVGHYSCTLAGACFLDLAQDEHIMDFFHQKVVNFSAHETFEAVVRCECIFGLGTVFQECEVAILRSCTNKLYILLIDATPDGQDISKLLGCYRFEEMREVVVGLGLQALRIYLEGSITYLFLTRSSEKSKSLLSLLRLCDSAASDNICPLKSWEQVQVKMLEKYVREYLKMGIFFYSMLLFCHENSEGESWFTRSIFVVEGNLLVCSENFIQFGSSMDNCGSTCPYYSLDSCCAIQDILEMGIEFGGNGSLSLTFVDVMSDTSKPRKWKVKWYSRDTLSQFVALLKAIHSGWTAAP